MKLTGELKKKGNEASDKAEVKGLIKQADMSLTDDELEQVAGGACNWQRYAKGSYVNYGQYIVYT